MKKKHLNMVDLIRPLFYSSLPKEIVVDEIFAKHLYKYQSRLDEEQKESIHQKHFLFVRILWKYYRMYEHSAMFYLDMLDNDLCLAINEGYPLTTVSQYLKDNPKVYDACLTPPSYDKDQILKYIYDLWCMLDSEKKTEVHDWIILHG
jgi:hypothetical protein